MARTVKEEDYTARRKEILDVAQRLMLTKGYELMSIQDVLVEAGISKGAFYHYFDSKQVLLEALVERVQEEITPLLESISSDPGLSAIEKLCQIFNASARWKSARKELMLQFLRVWYDDVNTIFRQKMFIHGLKWMAPILAQAIRQGIQEGTLHALYPERTGEILFSLFQGMGETMAEILLAPDPQPEDLQRLEELVIAYNDAMERILGAARGALTLIEPEMLREWFPKQENRL